MSFNIYREAEEVARFIVKNELENNLESSIKRRACPEGSCKDCYIRLYLKTIDISSCDDVDRMSYSSDVYKFSEYVNEIVLIERLKEVGFDFE